MNNWRWQGVPFYLRTGKRMPKKLTVIDVVFREPPVCLFGGQAVCRPEANVLRIQLQPNEGFDLSFEVKAPGDGFNLKTQTLHFGYKDAFGEPPGAYETLLLDVIQGDPNPLRTFRGSKGFLAVLLALAGDGSVSAVLSRRHLGSRRS